MLVFSPLGGGRGRPGGVEITGKVNSGGGGGDGDRGGAKDTDNANAGRRRRRRKRWWCFGLAFGRIGLARRELQKIRTGGRRRGRGSSWFCGRCGCHDGQVRLPAVVVMVILQHVAVICKTCAYRRACLGWPCKCLEDRRATAQEAGKRHGRVAVARPRAVVRVSVLGPPSHQAFLFFLSNAGERELKNRRRSLCLVRSPPLLYLP